MDRFFHWVINYDRTAEPTEHRPKWDTLTASQHRMPRFKFRIEGDVVRLSATPKPPRRVYAVFWLGVAISLALSAWMIVVGIRRPEPTLIAFGCLCAFFLPLMGFLPGLAVGLMAHSGEALKGDLLIVDRSKGQIELPREHRSFPIEAVQAVEIVQWTAHAYANTNHSAYLACVDYVLRLQSNDRNECVRIGCQPMLFPSDAKKLANLIGVPLYRFNLGIVKPEVQALGGIGYH
jgi:hypothetical protein